MDEVEAGQFRDGPLVVITSLDYDRLVDLLDDNEKVVLSYPVRPQHLNMISFRDL